MFMHTKYKVLLPDSRVIECQAKIPIDAANHVANHYKIAIGAIIKVNLDYDSFDEFYWEYEVKATLYTVCKKIVDIENKYNFYD